MFSNKSRVYVRTNNDDDDGKKKKPTETGNRFINFQSQFQTQSSKTDVLKNISTKSSAGINIDAIPSAHSINSMQSLDISSKFERHENDEHADNDEDEQNNLVATFTIEKLRIYAQKIFVTSRFGTIYDMVLLILSFVSAGQLIFQTTLPPGDQQSASQKDLERYFTTLEMILAVLFGFDWLLALFLAEVKSEFFLSFFSMVDLVTVIPIWFTHSAPLKYQDALYSNYDYFIYVLNALSNFRICRMFRLRKFIILMENAVERLLSEIILTGVVSLLFVAAMIQFLERQEDHAGAGNLDKDDYFNWFYFALITIFTVGYGDLYPLNRYGQLMTIIFIMIAVLLVPKMSNDFAEEIRATSPYSRLVYRKKGPKSRHVLICGDLTTTQMFELFAELFHEDHRDELSMTCVVLQPRPPTKDMFGLLNHPLYGLSLQYLEGSPLNTKDLIRAKAWDALAVFIMCNKFNTAADEEDSRVILQHTHIKRFVDSYKKSYRPQFFLQIIRPENRQHLSTSSNTTRTFGQEYKEVVVGISELKMGIMAKSVLNPGISALICNLISSFSEMDEDDETEEEADDSEIMDLRDRVQEVEYESWMNEYSMGCDWEIYSTKLSKIFTGNTFSAVAHSIYSKLGIVLMGLKLTQKDSKYSSIPPKILLNPHDLVIPSQDEYDVIGFVIAKNQQTADLEFSSDSGHTQLSVLTAGIRNIIQPITGDLSPDKGDDKRYHSILKMCKHLGMNLSDARSQQEKMQRQKDQYIQSRYYCRDKNASKTLISNTIYGYVTIDIPGIDGHTIITGRYLTNLKDLITPLRRISDGPLNYIVILTPDELPSDTWRSISHFEAVLYVRGSSLEENDLRRAGIYRASKIVVLANPTCMQEEMTNSTGASSVDQGLVDVDAIFSYQLIQRINPSANLIMEVVKEVNIAYLDNDTSELAVKDYKFSSAFAAGILFTPTLLDTLLVQSFYNQDMISLVSAMVGINDVDYNSVNINSNNNDDDDNDNNKKRNNNNNNKNINSYKSQSLYLAPIPDGIEKNRTYGTAFELFNNKGMLPLGLLRGVGHYNKFGVKGNKMEYVVANPPADTELFSSDRIYVLSHKPPISSSKRAKDGRNEMRRLEEARKSKQAIHKNTSNHNGDIGALRMKHTELQSQLQATIDNLESNNRNIEAIFKQKATQKSQASTLLAFSRAHQGYI